MRLSPALRIGVWITALCLCVQAQNPPGKDAQINEVKGLPPRVAPTDYQAQAQAGTVTVAAEFTGHSVATTQGTFSTEDYVVVETALFGPPGARIRLSIQDFSLRINEKKTLSSQPYGLVFHSLKDPEWEPPVPAESKSKTSIGGGGQGVKVIRRPRRSICQSSYSARWNSTFKRPRYRKETAPFPRPD